MPGAALPSGSGSCAFSGSSSLYMYGVSLLRPDSSALIAVLARFPFRRSSSGGRFFPFPIGEAVGGIMCGLRDFPTVRYQTLVGG